MSSVPARAGHELHATRIDIVSATTPPGIAGHDRTLRMPMPSSHKAFREKDAEYCQLYPSAADPAPISPRHFGLLHVSKNSYRLSSAAITKGSATNSACASHNIPAYTSGYAQRPDGARAANVAPFGTETAQQGRRPPSLIETQRSSASETTGGVFTVDVISPTQTEFHNRSCATATRPCPAWHWCSLLPR